YGEHKSIITARITQLSFNRKVRESHTFLESLNLAAPPLEREHSCLEGDVGFVELFKEYEIGEVNKEEIEKEDVVGVEEIGVEYFDKFPTKYELAYHKYLLCDPSPPFFWRCPTHRRRNSFKPQNTM
ncbi:hypothetical protein Tco_1519240, partial [Tanacetum coccineum]